MKFLMGIFIGITLSVGVMTLPEPRQQALTAVSSWVEKAKALLVVAGENMQPLITEKMVGQNEVENNTALSPVEPAPPELLPPELSPPVPSLTELFPPELFTTKKSPSETIQREFNQEPQVPTSSMFQVAWSPFRSETSANGFASTLEKQLTHEFRVIKTGPGRYEVGFHFNSQNDRSVILSAINDLTGFESTLPPRLVPL